VALALGVVLATSLEATYNTEHNRLLTSTGGGALSSRWSYAYDAAGFEVARASSTTTTTFDWNARGQIARIATQGKLDAAFVYDALGRRREATANGRTRRWRFGGMVEASASDVPVAIDLGEARFQLDGRHHFRHTDLRGNTKLRSDAAGKLESHASFSAYGPKLLLGEVDDDFLFAGGTRVIAGGSTFLLLGDRLLDPLTARVLAPDRVFSPVNAFTYTLGNPVDFWDSSGASPEAIHEGRVFFSGIAALAAIAAFAVAAPAVGSVAFVIGVAAILGTVGNFALNVIEWRMHPDHGANGSGASPPGGGGAGFVDSGSSGLFGAAVFDCFGGTCRRGIVTIIDL
jgi:YD repeat-containing protein